MSLGGGTHGTPVSDASVQYHYDYYDYYDDDDYYYYYYCYYYHYYCYCCCYYYYYYYSYYYLLCKSAQEASLWPSRAWRPSFQGVRRVWRPAGPGGYSARMPSQPEP